MEMNQIKNTKTGEAMTTKEGEPLMSLKFEIGDEFIPMSNTVFEKTREVLVKGKKQQITNYTLKCHARDKNGTVLKCGGTDELFVTITKAQADSLKKKIEAGVQLSQNLFVAYKYESKNYGAQVGLGLKKAQTPPKSFEDFEA